MAKVASGGTVSLRITLRYKDIAEFIERYAENISTAGLFLRTKAPKPSGTRIRFELLLADGSRALRGEGVVVTVRSDDKPGMALRFNELDADSQAVVDQLVQTHGQGSNAPTPLSTSFGRERAPSSPGWRSKGQGSSGWSPLGGGKKPTPRKRAGSVLPRRPSKLVTKGAAGISSLPSATSDLPQPPERDPTAAGRTRLPRARSQIARPWAKTDQRQLRTERIRVRAPNPKVGREDKVAEPPGSSDLPVQPTEAPETSQAPNALDPAETALQPSPPETPENGAPIEVPSAEPQLEAQGSAAEAPGSQKDTADLSAPSEAHAEQDEAARSSAPTEAPEPAQLDAPELASDTPQAAPSEPAEPAEPEPAIDSQAPTEAPQPSAEAAAQDEARTLAQVPVDAPAPSQGQPSLDFQAALQESIGGEASERSDDRPSDYPILNLGHAGLQSPQEKAEPLTTVLQLPDLELSESAPATVLKTPDQAPEEGAPSYRALDRAIDEIEPIEVPNAPETSGDHIEALAREVSRPALSGQAPGTPEPAEETPSPQTEPSASEASSELSPQTEPSPKVQPSAEPSLSDIPSAPEAPAKYAVPVYRAPEADQAAEDPTQAFVDAVEAISASSEDNAEAAQSTLLIKAYAPSSSVVSAKAPPEQPSLEPAPSEDPSAEQPQATLLLTEEPPAVLVPAPEIEEDRPASAGAVPSAEEFAEPSASEATPEVASIDDVAGSSRAPLPRDETLLDPPDAPSPGSEGMLPLLGPVPEASSVSVRDIDDEDAIVAPAPGATAPIEQTAWAEALGIPGSASQPDAPIEAPAKPYDEQETLGAISRNPSQAPVDETQLITLRDDSPEASPAEPTEAERADDPKANENLEAPASSEEHAAPETNNEPSAALEPALATAPSSAEPDPSIDPGPAAEAAPSEEADLAEEPGLTAEPSLTADPDLAAESELNEDRPTAASYQAEPLDAQSTVEPTAPLSPEPNTADQARLDTPLVGPVPGEALHDATEVISAESPSQASAVPEVQVREELQDNETHLLPPHPMEANPELGQLEDDPLPSAGPTQISPSPAFNGGESEQALEPSAEALPSPEASPTSEPRAHADEPSEQPSGQADTGTADAEMEAASEQTPSPDSPRSESAKAELEEAEPQSQSEAPEQLRAESEASSADETSEDDPRASDEKQTQDAKPQDPIEEDTVHIETSSPPAKASEEAQASPSASEQTPEQSEPSAPEEAVEAAEAQAPEEPDASEALSGVGRVSLEAETEVVRAYDAAALSNAPSPSVGTPMFSTKVSVTGVSSDSDRNESNTLPPSSRPPKRTGPIKPVVERGSSNVGNASGRAAFSEEATAIPPEPASSAFSEEATVVPPSDSVQPEVRNDTAIVRPEARGTSPERDRQRSREDRRFVGIDFGGRCARVGIIEHGELELIPLAGSVHIPALVACRNDGSIAVGAKAEIIHRRDQRRSLSLRMVLHSLRAGTVDRKRSKSVNILSYEAGRVLLKLGDRTFDFHHLLVTFFEALRSAITHRLGHGRFRVVISVPSDLDPEARTMLKAACKDAQLDIARIESESTAMLRAYNLEERLVNSVLLLDVGATHVGISIARRARDGFSVLAAQWDDNVSASELDARVVDLTLEELASKADEDHRNDPAARQALLDAVERARMDIHRASNVELKVTLPAPGGAQGVVVERTIKLPRSRIYQVTEEVVASICWKVQELLKEVDMDPRDVGAVVMAGSGGTFPPLVQGIQNLTTREPLLSVPPAHVFTLGLALAGQHMARQESATRPDTLNASIGIELPGGRFRALVATGSKLPARLQRRQPTTRDNQSELDFRFFQGDGEFVRSCTSLGTATIRDLPKGLRGEVSVSLELQVDRDGVVTISLSEPNSGVTSKTVLPTSQTPGARKKEIAAQPKMQPPSPKKKGFFSRLFGRR